LILVLALLAAGMAGYRERVREQELEAGKSGLALLTELRARGGGAALAESIFRANENFAYLKVRDVANQVDLAWYRSLALAEKGPCALPAVSTAGPGPRFCRPLRARVVDVKLAGLNPGDVFQAGLWSAGGPRSGGVFSPRELWSWLLVMGCGLALAWVLARRQGEPLRRLSQRAREVSAVIPPTHRPLDREDEGEMIEQTLAGLGKELRLHKVQLATAHSAFRSRIADSRRQLRQALKQQEQIAAKEKKELALALAELKTPLRHLAQMSRVLEQRIGDGLPLEDQGRMRRLLRESEKALHQLLEIETDLKLVTEREPVEQLNLSELIWKMGPGLEAEGIRVQSENPLPTLWLEPKRMERLFRELIHAAAGQAGLRSKTTVQVGYANLRDRLAFFVKGTRGAGVKKLSEDVNSWAQRLLQAYQGRIWVEYQPNRGGVIYFTLAKDSLTRKIAPEAEASAEAA